MSEILQFMIACSDL